jgi:hypothetical protein
VFFLVLLSACSSFENELFLIDQDTSLNPIDYINGESHIKESFSVSCVAKISPLLKYKDDMHVSKIIILWTNKVWFEEDRVTEDFYRYRSISEDYIDSFECENEKDYEKIKAFM